MFFYTRIEPWAIHFVEKAFDYFKAIKCNSAEVN